MFKTHPEDLKGLIDDIHDEKLQLPDFQRDWVWTDEGIRQLIASIAAGFPVGAILTLSTGGEVKFKPRPLEHAPATGLEPEELLLDGQQRMTSCYQAFRSEKPVVTQNSKGRPLSVFYFMDIQAALREVRLESAIRTVPDDLKIKTNFNRDIVLDLSTPELQYAAHMFPLNRVFDESAWFMGYQKAHRDLGFATWQDFKKRVLERVQRYKVPVIRLDKSNSREAVCTVFEKVNVGGQKLTAFELLTAMFAADSFDLREDLRGTDIDAFVRANNRRPREDEIQTGRLTRIKGDEKHGVFAELDERDVLQVATLLQTYAERERAKSAGIQDEKRLPAVSIKAEALLELKCDSYQRNADLIETGFIKARQFLNRLHIIRARDVPYLPAAKTLAAVYALWDGPEMNHAAQKRLEQWFWCISLGETYGASTDTRVVRDVQELLPWLSGEIDRLPRAIEEISIRSDRMERLRTRNAAGYKALHAALMDEGCLDFRTAKHAHQMDRHDDPVDIHHIFPQKWANENGIPRETYDTIVNKTPLFRQTNQKIGGNAPSDYLGRLEAELQKYAEQHDPTASVNTILETHLIDPALLRADQFYEFYAARKEALAQLIEKKTGRPVVRSDADDGDSEIDAPLELETV